MESSVSTAAESSETADTKALDNEKKISQLEHDIFTISKQLEEARDLLKDGSHQNLTLKAQVESLEAEKIEKSKLFESLEKSRNELIAERMKLQDRCIHLQSEKDAFENDVAKLLSERRRVIDELNAVKADCAKERKEKCLLQVKVDEFESEKNLIAYEKERWTREKEILIQGKQWCMREISNRETRINEIRIEMMKLEANVTREKFTMTEERDALTAKVDELTESVARREQELTDLRDRLQKIVEERGVTLNEMDAELRTKERLADLYKTSLEAANHEVEELKESESKLQNAVQENEISIVNLNAELEKLNADYSKDVAERDATIKNLNDELTKANELLRMSSRGVHRSDNEIAALSPSAAAASNLLRNGISLTSIYAEHCRVVSELEKKTAENERIERYVTELIQELEERAPRFKEQKEAYDNALEEIRRITLQNDLLSEGWNKVQGERDAIANELSFTKTELERYQHEHQALSMQVRRLLFAIERDGGSTHAAIDAETEERLFTNICELQQTNVDLIRKVKQLEEANAEVIRNAHNTENEALRAALQSAEKELGRIREAFSKSEMVILELTAQRDNYKKLCEEGGNIRTVSPPGTDKATLSADVLHWKSRVDFLQEKLDFFTADKQEMDRTFNERIDQQMEQIFQLRTTNGKLESALEYQKQNQQLICKNVEQLNKELKKATDDAAKLTVRIETLQARNDDLTNQLLNQQQELAQLRVSNYTLEEQLQMSRSNEHRANDELSVLRNTSFNTERVALTLQEVETILKRVDAEKQLSFTSQLQSANIERDNLKTLLDNINRQHAETSNKLKTTINELTGERDNALFELKNLQENYTSVESKLKIIKEEYEKLSSESLTSKVADDDIDGYKKEIQQLKNKCFYQEKQIKEHQDKTEELTKLVDLKENELQRVCSLSGNMENLIQEQNDYAEAERKRLQAICNQHEENLIERRKQIEELRNSVAALELQVLEKGRALEHAESRYHETEAKYNQKCDELDATKSSSAEAFEQLQQVVENLQAEFDNHKIQFANLEVEKKTSDDQLEEEKANVARLKHNISQLEVEVAKLKSSIDIAEREKLRLNTAIDEYKQRDVANVEKIEALYDRIKELLQKIECLESVQLASAGDIATHAFDNAQETGRLSELMGFLREQKMEETKLRMNAELDKKRLEAQASIDQQRIGVLETELMQLRTLAQTAANVAREKEEMLVKINAFREAQERYTLLKSESDNLKVQFEVLTKKHIALETAHKQLQREKLNADRTNASLTLALEQRKKEIVDLRERNEKAMMLASKYSPESYTALQTDFDATKEKLASKETEITLLKEQLQTAINDFQTKSTEYDEKVSAYDKNQKLLNQMRTIARQYRESANALETQKQKLETELEKVKSEYAAAIAASGNRPAEASTSWTTRNDARVDSLLREKIAELQNLKSKLEEVERAKTELAERVAQLEAELGEANEKNLRLDMITTSLNSQREKTEKLMKTLKEKDELIEQLQQQVQALTTISESNIDLLEPPLGGERTVEAPTSRKRQHSGEEPQPFSFGQEFHDKRSRVVESDPSLSLDGGDIVTESLDTNLTDSQRDAVLDSDVVATSATNIDNVEMEKETQEMLDEQIEYEYDDNESENDTVEVENEDEEEFTNEDEEAFDDDDGDDGPADENANEYEEDKHDASDEVICLSEDDESSAQDAHSTLPSDSQEPTAATLAEDATAADIPHESPKLYDANVEEEEQNTD